MLCGWFLELALYEYFLLKSFVSYTNEIYICIISKGKQTKPFYCPVVRALTSPQIFPYRLYFVPLYIFMKSFLLTLLFIGGLLGSAAAQKRDCYAERPGSTTPLTSRIDEQMRQMGSQLRLNEAQYIRLRAVSQMKLARLDELQYEIADAAQRHQKISELEAQFEAECSRILSPSQLSMLRAEQQPVTQPLPDPNEDGLG